LFCLGVFGFSSLRAYQLFTRATDRQWTSRVDHIEIPLPARYFAAPALGGNAVATL
jgi:hypothetical protein